MDAKLASILDTAPISIVSPNSEAYGLLAPYILLRSVEIRILELKGSFKNRYGNVMVRRKEGGEQDEGSVGSQKETVLAYDSAGVSLAFSSTCLWRKLPYNASFRASGSAGF